MKSFIKIALAIALTTVFVSECQATFIRGAVGYRGRGFGGGRFAIVSGRAVFMQAQVPVVVTPTPTIFVSGGGVAVGGDGVAVGGGGVAIRRGFRGINPGGVRRVSPVARPFRAASRVGRGLGRGLNARAGFRGRGRR